MTRFWLSYCDPSGELLGVVILDSYSLLLARFRAAVTEVDRGARFSEGRKLDTTAAAMVPCPAIGRMLKPHEARKLIRKMERGIPK
jgi:hypothetical protein